MSGIFSKYKERFAPNKQTDLMNIIESDKQMFQDYKKFFNREKMEGIYRHLCDYVILEDLLVNKESFVKAFDSIEKKRLLVGDLIKKVKSDDINLDEVDQQKLLQKIDNGFDEAEVFINKLREKSKASLKKMSTEVQKNFIKEMERIMQEGVISSPFLAMEKPKTLTAADLNLAAMNQNQYVKISYRHMVNKRFGHAVLIKKNSDNSFAFYDPNYGAIFDLTEEQLCEVVTQSFYTYVRMSKLGITALFILLSSVVAGTVAAVYGYNIIATVSLIICLVDLSISYYLREKLVSQEYDTIVSNNIVPYHELQTALENLINKYCDDNGEPKNAAVVSGTRVESANLGPVHNL